MEAMAQCNGGKAAQWCGSGGGTSGERVLRSSRDQQQVETKGNHYSVVL